MKVIEINGGKALEGSIKISGAKNATVALIPAAILASKNISTLCNVPDITDTDNLVNILEYLGCKVTRNTETMTIDATNVENKEISYEFSSKLRASYYFMGVLLARFKKVKMSFPGGCNIGKRPIDLHLKAFESMGATVKYDNSNFFIEAEELKGAEIYLDIASVGATINIMLAAALAKGTTIIHNAAKEPEIIKASLKFLKNDLKYFKQEFKKEYDRWNENAQLWKITNRFKSYLEFILAILTINDKEKLKEMFKVWDKRDILKILYDIKDIDRRIQIDYPQLREEFNKRIKLIFNEIGEQKEEIGLESMSDLAYIVYCYLSGNNGSEAIKIKEVLNDFND